MKVLLALVSLALLHTSCGSESNPDLQKSYSIDSNLIETNQVRLSFQKSYNYRYIKIDAEQSNECKAFAKEFDAEHGTDLTNASFQLTFDAPTRYCTKRNALKQCKGIKYVYTFHCLFQVK